MAISSLRNTHTLLLLLVLTISLVQDCSGKQEKSSKEKKPDGKRGRVMVSVTVVKKVYFLPGGDGGEGIKVEEECVTERRSGPDESAPDVSAPDVSAPDAKEDTTSTPYKNSSAHANPKTSRTAKLKEFLQMVDEIFCPSSPLDLSLIPHFSLKAKKAKTN